MKRLMMIYLMVAFISGCSDPVKRYRILSFFFDGVPPPKITEPEPTAKKEKDGDSTEKKLLGRPTEHGPYAAKMCYGCHKRDTNELIMPAEKLCLYCHDMNIENRWIHGPIAAGGCRVCHLPHSSGYAYMLVSEPREFCLYCHDKNDILKNDVHMYSDLRCLDCHDAHSGNDRFLLKN